VTEGGGVGLNNEGEARRPGGYIRAHGYASGVNNRDFLRQARPERKKTGFVKNNRGGREIGKRDPPVIGEDELKHTVTADKKEMNSATRLPLRITAPVGKGGLKKGVVKGRLNSEWPVS